MIRKNNNNEKKSLSNAYGHITLNGVGNFFIIRRLPRYFLRIMPMLPINGSMVFSTKLFKNICRRGRLEFAWKKYKRSLTELFMNHGVNAELLSLSYLYSWCSMLDFGKHRYGKLMISVAYKIDINRTVHFSLKRLIAASRLRKERSFTDKIVYELKTYYTSETYDTYIYRIAHKLNTIALDTRFRFRPEGTRTLNAHMPFGPSPLGLRDANTFSLMEKNKFWNEKPIKIHNLANKNFLKFYKLFFKAAYVVAAAKSTWKKKKLYRRFLQRAVRHFQRRLRAKSKTSVSYLNYRLYYINFPMLRNHGTVKISSVDTASMHRLRLKWAPLIHWPGKYKTKKENRIFTLFKKIQYAAKKKYFKQKKFYFFRRKEKLTTLVLKRQMLDYLKINRIGRKKRFKKNLNLHKRYFSYTPMRSSASPRRTKLLPDVRMGFKYLFNIAVQNPTMYNFLIKPNMKPAAKLLRLSILHQRLEKHFETCEKVLDVSGSLTSYVYFYREPRYTPYFLIFRLYRKPTKNFLATKKLIRTIFMHKEFQYLFQKAMVLTPWRSLDVKHKELFDRIFVFINSIFISNAAVKDYVFVENLFILVNRTNNMRKVIKGRSMSLARTLGVLPYFNYIFDRMRRIRSFRRKKRILPDKANNRSGKSAYFYRIIRKKRKKVLYKTRITARLNFLLYFTLLSRSKFRDTLIQYLRRYTDEKFY